MFHALSLLSVLLLSTSTLANPLPRFASTVVLPVSRRFNSANTAHHNIVEVDQAHARALRERASSPPSNDQSPEPVTNAVVTYIASVGVGTPPTQYDLIVDTGSSNTWVGANKPYVKTSSSHLTEDVVAVTYGSGMFTGLEYTDTVLLTPSLVINNQGLGGALDSEGFQGVDGILGLGPTDLTIGTLTPDRSKSVPTVVDNLHAQGDIPAPVLGVSFNPISSSDPNGELSFGGADGGRYTGDITYTPITSTSPASAYWGIDSSATYGGTTIMSTTAGIVDTGTTLILIATDAFNTYKSATGGVMDMNTGLLKITNDQYSALQPLVISIGGENFELSPNAQIWPRSHNTDIGGDENAIYLVVSDMGLNSGTGLDFILGYSFLERFYSVYDTDNSRVGIATTPFTDSTTN